jgi:hypothetical protein
MENNTSLILSIIFIGLVAGALASSAIKIGNSLSIDSFLMKTFGSFCDTVKNLPESGEAYITCKSSFIILTAVLSFFSFLGILVTASKYGNIIKGILLYFAGWFIGFFLIYFLF